MEKLQNLIESDFKNIFQFINSERSSKAIY